MVIEPIEVSIKVASTVAIIVIEASIKRDCNLASEEPSCSKEYC
jgi:hypothetical protein